ncbi:hypothetical protein H9P43_008814 [Blastocladiella emersonii ATCC 22665]|nr:hypothetical protein H9P43_008814 [Blastocladiella emersonii ATCC 22665]
MIRRVQTICIRRTWFLTKMAPVTIAVAIFMFPVNLAVGILDMAAYIRAGQDLARYEVSRYLLALGAIQAGWCVGCTFYAYRVAFAGVKSTAPEGPGLGARIRALITRSKHDSPTSPNGVSSTLPLPVSDGHATLGGSARSNPDQRRHTLLASIQQTYFVMTFSYAVGWAISLAVFGGMSQYLTLTTRAGIAASLSCGAILQETQFRRIVRSRVSKSKAKAVRPVAHFDDTVGNAITMGAPMQVGQQPTLKREANYSGPIAQYVTIARAGSRPLGREA